MKCDPITTINFNIPSNKLVKAEDLFLPSVIEIVKHMARMAAENDYKHFLATGEMPYFVTDRKEGGND
jgi:hypothetical protein